MSEISTMSPTNSADAADEQEHGLLRLYVTGQSPKCMAALSNLRRLCTVELQGRFEIEVVDLLENPKLASGDQIIAVPTLVRRLPPPITLIIGGMSANVSVHDGQDHKERVGE